MERREKEAVRYLGFGKNAVDDRTLALIRESFEDLDREAGKKSVHRIFEPGQITDERIVIGPMDIRSRSLSRNLRGCDKVILFGATLGTGADRLITRTSLTDMAKAAVLQACAAALLEEYCDECQQRIAEEMEAEGRYLRPRFSPGYGDFDIRHQETLMRMLDCAKSIGLTMTDSFMMTPTKSVTALIGAGRTRINCPVAGCETCGKKDCAFRR
ncbi:MAG TPA: Vitamin B12 dependent methionine synthase activation subunit [Candidatus Mediterraneibacter intestinavium]|nr:Vitamin B12 dependent methionine synthase activation subunit [Candidatus Mediterraneibacter intestinavium]